MLEKEPPPSSQPFEFSEREKLYDQMSHARLLDLLADEQTRVHKVELSENSYGEFLFVTLSHPREQKTEYLTFYGLGYHEYRERWITDVWAWYRGNELPDTERQRVSMVEARQQIAERLAQIRPDGGTPEQSPRAKLYEFLADFTDEDGAISEMEDLEGLADWLFGDEDDTE